MKRLDQRGLTSWLAPFVIVLLLFLLTAGFGIWAFMGRSDYKNNVDTKIAEAVAAAEKVTSDKKDTEFKEKEKSPTRTYTGPSAYASVSITYPKTWSAYVDETGRGSGGAIIDGYFNPAVVPGLQSGNSFAIRFQVLGASYVQEVSTLTQQAKTGKVVISPFNPDKVKSVTGVRVTGAAIPNKQVNMIILPVRDKTLKIWSEATQFDTDLNTIVLPNLTFVP